MKKRRLLIAVILAAALLVSGLVYGYFSRHAMQPVDAYEAGSPALARHVLIAAQGSAFKDALVTGLVLRLVQRPVHVKVIDVSGLPGVEGGDWQAIVIVHSWEFGRPPPEVGDFVARIQDRHRIIDVTTSGSGREKLPGVDVISSASVVDDIPALLAEIEMKIDAVFAGD